MSKLTIWWALKGEPAGISSSMVCLKRSGEKNQNLLGNEELA